MSYQFTIYAIPAIIGAIVECTLAVVAWRRRSTRGAPQFAVLMACCGLASFMSIFGLSAVDRNSLVVASMFGTVGLTAASPTFFLFAAYYSGVRWAQSTPVFWFLIAFLAAYLLMVLSDNVAGTQFLTRTLEFDRSGGFGAVVRTRGPVFAPAIAVFNVITISGIVMLVRAALIAPAMFRRQTVLMAVGGLLPGVVTVSQFAGLSPIRGFDMTGIGFLLSGLVLAWALFREKGLQIVPIEQALLRNAIVASMRDAVVTLDRQGRVLDLNVVAESLLNTTRRQAVGKDLALVAPQLQGETGDYDDRLVGLRDRTYELHVTPVDDREGSMGGSLLVLQDVTEELALQSELTRLAFSDSLTGLANRTRLIDDLQMRLRSGGDVSVLFIDLDGFKTVNDSLGHNEGDVLLAAVSLRLLSCLGSHDLIARFGGDEFVVVIDEPDERSALKIADGLVDALRLPFRLGGRDVPVSASIGVAAGRQFSSADDLLRAADTAMYAAKRAGKSRAMLFDDVMQREAVRRLELGTDLRDALVSPDLGLDIDERDRSTAEAWLVWRHAAHGIIMEPEILSIALDAGLGPVVTRRALEDAIRWLREHGDRSIRLHLGVWFAELTSELRTLLADSIIRPDRLRLAMDRPVSGSLDGALLALGIGMDGEGREDGLAEAGLTTREQEVAMLVARGMSNAEIAAHLVISVNTVGFHLKQIFEKTGYRSRVQLAVWVLQQHVE